MILKVIFANSVEQSDLGPHCLPVCKNRFEKFPRIFSRRHKQTTFSDAGFLGVLSVKVCVCLNHRGPARTGYFWLKCQKVDIGLIDTVSVVNRYSVYQTYVYFLAILAKNNPVCAGPLCSE